MLRLLELWAGLRDWWKLRHEFEAYRRIREKRVQLNQAVAQYALGEIDSIIEFGSGGRAPSDYLPDVIAQMDYIHERLDGLKPSLPNMRVDDLLHLKCELSRTIETMEK